MSVPTIDSHQHFWRYNAEEFAWIDDSMSAIRRDFLPAHLEKEMLAAGVDAVVSVQARTSLEETEWLLQLASAHPWITGVVGWLPLGSPQLPAIVERLLASSRQLVAVREVMQGKPQGALLEPSFNRGVSLLEKSGIAYDLLIFEHQLPEAAVFAKMHPDLTLVLDHLAKPQIEKGEHKLWARNLLELAAYPNVSCKISGMATEAGADWTPDALRPFFESATAAFSPGRLMFGSDWPVCLTHVSYQRWVDLNKEWTRGWSQTDRNGFFGNNAHRIYQLPLTA